MLEMPTWRMVPEPVLINCLKVHELPNSKEYIVQFKSQRGNFTSFVPKQHVDPVRKGLHALIIADVRDKGYLVGLPVETLTSGPRLLVFESEKDDVLTFRDWAANHDS